MIGTYDKTDEQEIFLLIHNALHPLYYKFICVQQKILSAH